MSENPYEDLIQNPRAAPTPSVSDVPPQLASPGGNPYETLITAPQPPPPPKQRAFNEPFGELKPAQYSPSERVGNWMQDALIAGGMQPYSAGHIGRGVRDAASLIPPVGVTRAGADLIYHSPRLEKDAKGDYVAAGDPFLAGANAIGLIPGGTMARRAVQGMPTRTLSPSIEQVVADKTRSYNAWENAPVTYHPRMMDDAVSEITRAMIQGGADPATKQSALNIGLGLKTAGFPPRGLTNNDFEILRRQLSGGADKTEIRAGEIAKDALEQFMINPPAQHIRSGTPQEIAAARENLLRGRAGAAAEKRSDVISGKADIADVKEERGKDYIDTFRGRMDALHTTKAGQKELRGFNEEERNRVRDEVAGTLTERAMGGVGKAIDKAAPYIGGLGTLSTGAAGGLGTAFGLDPVTATGLGVLAYTGGKVVGKGMQGQATDLAKRSADELSAAMRMRSPLAQDPGSPFGRVTDPSAVANDLRKYLMYPQLRQQAEDYVNRENVPFENR